MSIHRIVQSTRLKKLSSYDRGEAFNVMLSILAACFPRQEFGSHMHELWDACELFLAHVLAFDRAVQEFRPTFGEETRVYVNMMCDVTWYLWELGQHREALRLLQSTESICSQSIGLKNLEGARIFVNQGCVYSTLNQYHDAGKLFKRALDIREELLQQDHPLLACSYMQMGNTHLNISSQPAGIRSAIDAHQKSLAICLKSPVPDPVAMMVAYHNFCRSLMMGGRLGDAEANLALAEELEVQLGASHRTELYYKSQ
jgi:tetratricopeptide (TPR) repeat protein